MGTSPNTPLFITTGKRWAELQPALDRGEHLIRSLIHGHLHLPQIEVRIAPLPSDDDGLPPDIGMYDAQTARLTLDPDAASYGDVMHELGHYIDHSLDGASWQASQLVKRHAEGETCSEATRDAKTLGDWWKAVNQTAGVRALRAEVADQSDTTDELRLEAEYMLLPCELFARGFCHWAALRSGDKELAEHVQTEYWCVWPSTADFSAVAVAFDDLFAPGGPGEQVLALHGATRSHAT